MSVALTERQGNTDEQVREYVGKALALIDELDVPDDLRPAAFKEAVGLYAAKTLIQEQVPDIQRLLGNGLGG